MCTWLWRDLCMVFFLGCTRSRAMAQVLLWGQSIKLNLLLSRKLWSIFFFQVFSKVLKWTGSRNLYHQCWPSTSEKWEGCWRHQWENQCKKLCTWAMALLPHMKTWSSRPHQGLPQASEAPGLTIKMKEIRQSTGDWMERMVSSTPHITWGCLVWKGNHCFKQYTLCSSRFLFLEAKLLHCSPCHSSQGFLLEIPVSQ